MADIPGYSTLNDTETDRAAKDAPFACPICLAYLFGYLFALSEGNDHTLKIAPHNALGASNILDDSLRSDHARAESDGYRCISLENERASNAKDVHVDPYFVNNPFYPEYNEWLRERLEGVRH